MWRKENVHVSLLAKFLMGEMMKIILEEVEGKKKGLRFEIERDEADNIIVGRSSRPNPKFSSEDSQLH